MESSKVVGHSGARVRIVAAEGSKYYMNKKFQVPGLSSIAGVVLSKLINNIIRYNQYDK